MDKRFLYSICTIFTIGLGQLYGADQTTTSSSSHSTTTTTTTTTIVTETVETVKKQWQPFKVCVLDFTSADIMGQKRFLDVAHRPIVIPPQSTLTAADRFNMCPVMQGWVRMIDARDNAATNEANRRLQWDDNEFERAKALELYNSIVKGPSRPMIVGADYLSAYLGKYNDVFSCMDQNLITAAMVKLQAAEDFPKSFLLRLARETGATHLIYGTVSDIRSFEKNFKGYGIETKTLTFQMDVIVKMVDLVSQGTVYSNVYTASHKLQYPVSETAFSNDVFQTLMQSALQMAADDLYRVCKPGAGNKVTVTPLP